MLGRRIYDYATETSSIVDAILIEGDSRHNETWIHLDNHDRRQATPSPALGLLHECGLAHKPMAGWLRVHRAHYTFSDCWGFAYDSVEAMYRFHGMRLFPGISYDYAPIRRLPFPGQSLHYNPGSSVVWQNGRQLPFTMDSIVVTNRPEWILRILTSLTSKGQMHAKILEQEVEYIPNTNRRQFFTQY